MLLPSRSAAVRRIRSLALTGRSVLVTAPSGNGLTTVLDEVAARTGALQVSGRESVADTPLVPFARHLAAQRPPEHDKLWSYTEFPRLVAGKHPVAVVDDACSLDTASSVMVAQLLRAGVALVLGVREKSTLHPSLRDAVGGFHHERLAPLDEAETAELAAIIAGGELTAPSVARIARRAQGVPAVVAEITRAAVEQDGLRRTQGGWHLTRVRVGARALESLGATREEIARHQDLLTELAVASSLPVEALDAESLHAAMGAGLVHIDGTRTQPLHPLLTDTVLADLTPARLTAVAISVADRVAASQGWSEHARLLQGYAGTGRPEDAAAAVAWLLGQDRVEEARRLTEPLATTYAVCLLRAQLSIADADRAAALHHLDEAAALATTDEERLAVVLQWAAFSDGTSAGDSALARRIATAVADLEATAARDEVMRVLERRRTVLGRGGGGPADDLTEALTESLGGTLAVARQRAAALPWTREISGPEIDLDAHFGLLIHFLSLVYDGQLELARAIADEQFASAERTASPVLGLWAYNRTKIAFHAGQHLRAVQLGRVMRRHLAWQDVAAQRAPGEALLASALARIGHLDEALAIVASIDNADRGLPRVAIGIARVEAERLLAQGDVAAAAAGLVSAGIFATENGEAHSGSLAIDEAFVLQPRPETAALLETQRGASQLVDTLADRAAAVLAGDAEALARAATRLDGMIQPGRAAWTWLRAADLSADPARSTAHLASSRRVLEAWEATRWPGDVRPDASLTTREREVAVRAAQRLRSREIADELGLSVRTVDNHLARIFKKLGVANRDELADVLES